MQKTSAASQFGFLVCRRHYVADRALTRITPRRALESIETGLGRAAVTSKQAGPTLNSVGGGDRGLGDGWVSRHEFSPVGLSSLIF